MSKRQSKSSQTKVDDQRNQRTEIDLPRVYRALIRGFIHSQTASETAQNTQPPQPTVRDNRHATKQPT